MLESDASDWSSMNCGTMVDLPQPASPTIHTTLCCWSRSKILHLYSKIGREEEEEEKEEEGKSEWLGALVGFTADAFCDERPSSFPSCGE